MLIEDRESLVCVRECRAERYGWGGFVVFSPRKNYIGMRERGEISSGEGKWIPEILFFWV
jgi:hypothetical protein